MERSSEDLDPPTPLDTERLARWIAEQATAFDQRDILIEGFCNALVAAGLPLWRASVSMPAIDPASRSYTLNWLAGGGTSLMCISHEDDGAMFLRSPIQAILNDGRRVARWRLDALDPGDTFPILHELRADGGTDYILHLIEFAPGTAMRGVAVSFTTKAAAGFGEADLAQIVKVLPAFALAMCKLGLSQTLQETLGTYLGRAAGARVLDGQIRRGEGRTVAAAILLTDLRGFTALTDRADPLRVVGWLDEHFDALGDPVLDGGGEILKFLGDGFLSIFPVSDPDARPCLVCKSALEAARRALAANRALNSKRRAADMPALEADIVLHFGEVVYGNVGTSRRLDFTVIGKAVNEASRMEKLCETFSRSVLVSDAFATRCGRAFVPVGTVPLRGLERPQRIWGLPDEEERADAASAEAS